MLVRDEFLYHGQSIHSAVNDAPAQVPARVPMICPPGMANAEPYVHFRVGTGACEVHRVLPVRPSQPIGSANMDATITRPCARMGQQLHMRPGHNLQNLAFPAASTSGPAIHLDAPAPARLLSPARQTSLSRTQQQSSTYARRSRTTCAAGTPQGSAEVKNVPLQVHCPAGLPSQHAVG